MPKLSGTSKEYLNGQGNWSEIPLATTNIEGLIHKLPENNPDSKFLNGNNTFTNLPIVNTTQSGIFTATMYNNLNNTTSTLNNQINNIQDSYSRLNTDVTSLKNKSTNINKFKYLSYKVTGSADFSRTAFGNASTFKITSKKEYLIIGDIKAEIASGTNVQHNTGYGRVEVSIGKSQNDLIYLGNLPLIQYADHFQTGFAFLENLDTGTYNGYIMKQSDVDYNYTLTTRIWIIDIYGVGF